jgi:N-acetylneuraminic acid mutarotase
MKTNRLFVLLFSAALLFTAELAEGKSMTEDNTKWTDLPALPEALAGQCVGTSGDWLIVAGGSLWTAPPWAAGVKQWSDRVYGLRASDTAWKLLGHLPMPAGYGASAQWKQRLVCAGGQNATDVFRHVRSIGVDHNGALQIEELPELPQPLTNAAAAVAGDQLFLIGGQHSIHPDGIAHEGLRLDLRDAKEWKPLILPWDHSRILPAVAGCDDTLYVAGGADLSTAADGSPVRKYLRDTWSFEVRKSAWTRMPGLPAPVTAAPSLCLANHTWLLFGGDDGMLAARIQELRDSHPGFRKAVLRYDAVEQRWESAGSLPLSLVTTGAALWHGHLVIAGGENQPGHRSPRVIQADAPLLH